MFIAVTCFAIAIAVPYWIPKRQVLTLNDAYVGYYRGLGLTQLSLIGLRRLFRPIPDI